MKIESNINEVTKGLSDFEKKQLPYIMMLTTNNIAFDFRETMSREIKRELNITKKAIPNSLRIKKATKKKPYAEIFVDEWSWQHKVLEHHFIGGNRERKGLEKALIYWGMMYRNEILTPPPGIKVRPSVYVQILSQLKLDYKAGYNSNETTKSRLRKAAAKKIKARYFIITGKSMSPLAPGIYARMPGHNRPISILRIAEKPNYRKRFDLKKTLEIVYYTRGSQHYASAFERAMSTAW